LKVRGLWVVLGIGKTGRREVGNGGVVPEIIILGIKWVSNRRRDQLQFQISEIESGYVGGIREYDTLLAIQRSMQSTYCRQRNWPCRLNRTWYWDYSIIH
jgi:hypothetical protein